MPKLDLAESETTYTHPVMAETNITSENAELHLPKSSSPYPPSLLRKGPGIGKQKGDKNQTMSESPVVQQQHYLNDNEDVNGQLHDINRHDVTAEAIPATTDDHT